MSWIHIATILIALAEDIDMLLIAYSIAQLTIIICHGVSNETVDTVLSRLHEPTSQHF